MIWKMRKDQYRWNFKKNRLSISQNNKNKLIKTAKEIKHLSSLISSSELVDQLGWLGNVYEVQTNSTYLTDLQLA